MLRFKVCRILLLLCALYLSFASAKSGQGECSPDLPHLQAGHIQLTDANYSKWKKDNSKLHVLGISDSSCSQCCQTESILAQLQEKFDQKVYTAKKGKKVQIGRADIGEQYAFFKNEGIPIDDVPAIFIMHDGTYFRYAYNNQANLDDISGILHFINRLQHPLVQLDTEEDIQRFLDESSEFEETTGFLKKEPVMLGEQYTSLKHKTRVLVFMFDKEEYDTEMKIIREAGRLQAQRVSVRMGLVTDHKLIRLYKSRRGNSWFNDEVQLSTIVVQRFDKQSFPMDIFTVENVSLLLHFINKKSLMPVTELDPESGRLLEMVGQQVLVGLTNFNSKDAKVRDQSKELVERTLEAIAPTLYRGMCIATAEFASAPNFIRQLGISESNLPLIYITDTYSSKPIIYKGELEQDAIRVWAQDLLKNSQNIDKNQIIADQIDEHKPQPVKDNSLVKTFKEAKVKQLKSREELDNILAFQGDDLCIFAFSTAIDEELNRIIVGQYANLSKEVLRNTKRMQFYAYDLNQLGFHAAIGDQHPNLWFSPGSQRDKSPKLFRGGADKIEEMAEWLKKHADNKFQMTTKNLDQKIQMLEYAQQQGIGLDGQEKPKNIMDEVEAELMRRGEL